jgi:hypothetical protein
VSDDHDSGERDDRVSEHRLYGFQNAATCSIVAFLRSNLDEEEINKNDVGAHGPAEKAMIPASSILYLFAIL